MAARAAVQEDLRYRELVKSLADRGEDVVVTGRDSAHAGRCKLAEGARRRWDLALGHRRRLAGGPSATW
jgi:hypothetical protein